MTQTKQSPLTIGLSSLIRKPPKKAYVYKSNSDKLDDLTEKDVENLESVLHELEGESCRDRIGPAKRAAKLLRVYLDQRTLILFKDLCELLDLDPINKDDRRMLTCSFVKVLNKKLKKYKLKFIYDGYRLGGEGTVYEEKRYRIFRVTK